MCNQSMLDIKARTLLDAIAEDAMTASPDEIRENLRASGHDPDETVAQMRAMALKVVTNFRKSHP
jgi:hypothetical protein